MLNFGGSLSKGFLKHQIRRERVLWEVDNYNSNSFYPRKSIGEDILIRPFVCGWVSTCESEWVRISVTLFLEDAIQTYIFVRSLSNFIHKSTIMRGGILLICGQSQRLRSHVALSLCNIVGLIQISFFAQSLWNCTYRLFMTKGDWYGDEEFKVRVNPFNRGHDTDYILCPINLKLHTHVVKD